MMSYQNAWKSSYNPYKMIVLKTNLKISCIDGLLLFKEDKCLLSLILIPLPIYAYSLDTSLMKTSLLAFIIYIMRRFASIKDLG